MEAAYLQMVGRDSWSDLCFEHKAEWACETYGWTPKASECTSFR